MRSVGNKMKKLLLTASLLMLATQASAWVSKSFVPTNVSDVNVLMSDLAEGGCWTNISEVKRYTEDKLELAGFNVSRDKFKYYNDMKHYRFSVSIKGGRNSQGTCYGSIILEIFKLTWVDKVKGMFILGQGDASFSAHKNANQYVLEIVNEFMEQVENPNF